MYSGGPRIAEIHCLLDKEIQLLNAIERKWFAIRKDISAMRAERYLDKLGEPIKWKGYKSITTQKLDLLEFSSIKKKHYFPHRYIRRNGLATYAKNSVHNQNLSRNESSAQKQRGTLPINYSHCRPNNGTQQRETTQMLGRSQCFSVHINRILKSHLSRSF